MHSDSTISNLISHCRLLCVFDASSYACTCTPANYPLPAVFVCLLTCLLLWVLICFLMCVCMYACKLCALPAVLVRLLICRVNVSLCVLICVYMYVRLKLCTSPAVLTCVYHTRICYTDMVSTYIDMTYCACISYHHVSTRATHISHMSSKCE